MHSSDQHNLLVSRHILALVIAGLLVFLAKQAEAAEKGMPKQHFSATNLADAVAWQESSRELLFQLLKLSDLQATRQPGGKPIAFDAKVLVTQDHEKYTLQEVEFDTTQNRRIKVLITLPKSETHNQAFPAIVCIHGHGGNRRIVYDSKSPYRGFAAALAEDEFVTISPEVGQHHVFEADRTLMGERLWDVLRCADYLTTLEEVDPDRMGCAGLSLGGEMTMWLGAMDPRMKAVVSSGFLTTVANMRVNHCMCWDFPGFTENFEFSDIYALTAPRALLCQIGAKERAPGGFPENLARQALKEVQKAYGAFDATGNVALDVHPEGHIYVIPTAQQFLKDSLGARTAARLK